MIKEHDRIVLLKDISAEGLLAGDVGTVVHIHNKGEAFEIEVMTVEGETVCIVTFPSSQVRAIGKSDIAHARKLAIS